MVCILQLGFPTKREKQVLKYRIFSNKGAGRGSKEMTK